MPDGSISQGLVYKIRDRLGDFDNKVIPNDKIIYEKLTDYQRDFMTIFHTTTQEFEYDVTLNTTEEEMQELALDGRFLRLKSWRANNLSSDTEDDIIFYFDIPRRKIIVEYCATATKLIIKAFIQPATHVADNGETVSDDITKTFDPIIGSTFHSSLVDAVLSEYSTKQRPFKSLDAVYQRVSMLADEIQGVN